MGKINSGLRRYARRASCKVLREARAELTQLHKLVNSLAIFIDEMPPLISICLNTFMSEIKHLQGYIDCMIANCIETPNE